MILKSPYKIKSYKGRKLFFSVEGIYHRGSMPLMFLGVLPRLVWEPEGGGTILKNPYKTINNKVMISIFSVGGIYHNGSMP